jgi:hypothetical protein
MPAFDKHIARLILDAQLADKMISEEYLAEMNPDARNEVIS